MEPLRLMLPAMTRRSLAVSNLDSLECRHRRRADVQDVAY